jgi:sugar O-acyltransferase (sialic acid O-acetyltransferase NeuD family)
MDSSVPGPAVTAHPVVILGGPGDGIVVAEAIAQSQAALGLSLVGFLNDRLLIGETIGGVKVLGPFEAWSELPADVRFLPAIHKVKDMTRRMARIESLRIPDDRWASVVHHTAMIADDVSIGCGSFVGQYVTIQPGARIGRFASLRAGANIGHDAVVHEFAYVGPNAVLCGRASLGVGAHLGPNGVIVDAKVVGDLVVVGAGSVVTKKVADRTVVMGNPAQKVGAVA